MAFLFRRGTKEVDPVCGMEVDPQKAAATLEHGGKTSYFCSPGCKTAFAKDPDSLLKQGPKGMDH